jgi:hydroxyacylglutathione hydrolase
MMELVALPAFADNYIWMLTQADQALVVDPGDAAPVCQALAQRGLRLTGILVTHHHGDHVGGVADLIPMLEGPLWAPRSQDHVAPFVGLQGGERLHWNDLTIDVLAVPGHTLDHLAYHLVPPHGSPLLFCGDTLFSGGCGRLFEGSAEQMHASLMALSTLPDDTQVCCAHEYTVSNLRFAQAVEPGNPDIRAALELAQATRAAVRPTLPSRLARERRINPFLRCAVPDVARSAQARGPAATPAEVFATLRAWKNDFR